MVDYSEADLLLNSPVLSPFIANVLTSAQPETAFDTLLLEPESSMAEDNLAIIEIDSSLPPQHVNTQSISDLEANFSRFVNETNDRLQSIESGIGFIVKTLAARGMSESALKTNPMFQLGVQQPTIQQEQAPTNIFAQPRSPTMPSPCADCPDCPASPASVVPLCDENSLALHMSNTEAVWYTKRPLPWFDVTITDKDGNRPVHTENWEMVVRLVDGNGEYADHALLPAGPLKFPVNEGRVIVSGLKFGAVSSRNGGSFQIEATLTKPARLQLTPARSTPMRVLSERLYSEAKANSVLEMKPTDTVIHIPGIGKKYTTRLADCGIRTLADLAELDITEHGRQDVLELLDSVKKERGTLTEGKLMEIVKDAKVVVKRHIKHTTPARSTSTDTTDLTDSAASCTSDPLPLWNADEWEETPPKRQKMVEDFDFGPSLTLSTAQDSDQVDMMLNEIAIDAPFSIGIPVF